MNIVLQLSLHSDELAADIFLSLKNLSINHHFVYRAIELYQEPDDVLNWRQTGHPRSERMPKLISAVRARVQ